MKKLNNEVLFLETGEVGGGIKCYIACGIACFIIGGGVASFVAGIGSAL